MGHRLKTERHDRAIRELIPGGEGGAPLRKHRWLELIVPAHQAGDLFIPSVQGNRSTPCACFEIMGAAASNLPGYRRVFTFNRNLSHNALTWSFVFDPNTECEDYGCEYDETERESVLHSCE
jgi:hypothetical protein